MREHRIFTSEFGASIGDFRAGDRIYLSGTIYTARDAAHRRIHDDLDRQVEPFPIRGNIIYYTGPCFGVNGQTITSAGPTTSGRMDVYTPRLLELGLKATIGKGPRADSVREAQIKYGALYLAATGGAGALLAQCIKEYRVVCYPDLGPESILELLVSNFPLIVANDLAGNSIYR